MTNDGIEGIHGVGEADEPRLCPCGNGYDGHDSAHLRRRREIEFDLMVGNRVSDADVAWYQGELCARCGVYPRLDVTVGGARHLCQQCLDRARARFTVTESERRLLDGNR